MNVFINEFHYDNASGDTGEFIEIAGPSGFDLTGYSIVLYNGSNGAAYNTINLNETLGGSGVGFAVVNLPSNGIQNGAPDGIALVDANGDVLEFLSYEGSFTAVGGPADGVTSTDIGVSESGGDPVGLSLQLNGTGEKGADFTWSAPAAETPGAANTDQTFTTTTPIVAPTAENALQATILKIENVAGAEISAFDPETKQLFVTADGGVQVLDVSDPANPSDAGKIDLASVTSVAVKNGVVAVASPADPETDNGEVRFYDAMTLSFLGAVTVGALPDMVTFDETGAYVLVANEGESAGSENEPDILPNPEGSVSIITLDTGDLANSAVVTLGFTDTSITTSALTAKGVRINPNAPSAAADLEPEYITIEGSTAFVTLQENNAVAVIHDITNPQPITVDDIQPLGTQDFSQVLFDPSNRDDGINLQNAPVHGLRMPDAIASYVVDGVTYYVTANEGDGRDVDESRGDDLVDGDLTNGEIDPDAFSDEIKAQLADEAQLGRLKFSNVDGDTDGDGAIEQLTAFGARSFSIFDENGNLVFDSGDDFATITATEVPDIFNSNGAEDSFDSRSDDKGAEPEGVAVGEIDGLTYAFVGLERVGGVMVYDITDPQNATFEQYIRIPDDLGPEGLEFIPADQSPTGAALLTVSSEVSETVTFIELSPTAPLKKISEIQGETNFTNFTKDGAPAIAQVGVDDLSLFEGATVTIEAVVTADMQDGANGPDGSDLNGFFVMEETDDQDDNPFTSEGLFVFDGNFSASVVDVKVGDVVRVTGTVDEFFGQTELKADSVEVIFSGATLPDAAEIDMETIGVVLDDDGEYVADFEAYEGMLVTIPEALTVSEMFNLDRFGEYRVSADGRPQQFTQTNDPDVDGFDAHLQEVAARSIVFDDGQSVQNPAKLEIIDGGDGVLDAQDSFRMGDEITNATGVVGYSFDAFRLQDPTGDYSQTNPRPATPDSVGGDLKVASFNVLNFFTTLDVGGAMTANGLDPRGADNAEEFERQLEKLLDAIEEIDADILGLVELENDFADDSDGNAIAFLVEQLNDRLGDGTYAAVDPGASFVGTDAISTGLIYKPDSVTQKGDAAFLVFDEASAATTLATASALNDFVSPDDQVGDFQRNRPAVAATFEDENGETLTVAVNHFKSKGDSNLEDTFFDATNGGAPQALIDALLADPNYDQNDGAGFWNQVRADAAQELADWLATDPTGQGAENIMIVGDLNAYAQEDPLKVLATEGYANIVGELIGEDARSFVFDGQTGTLDYALANSALFEQVAGVTEWNINADEADAIDYNLDFGRDPNLFNPNTPARNSDHDPIVVGLSLEPEMLLANSHIEFEFEGAGSKWGFFSPKTKVVAAELHEGAADGENSRDADAIVTEFHNSRALAANRDVRGDDGVDLVDFRGGGFRDDGLPDVIDFVSRKEAKEAGRGADLEPGDVIEHKVVAKSVSALFEFNGSSAESDAPFGVGFAVQSNGAGRKGEYGRGDRRFDEKAALNGDEFLFVELSNEDLVGVDVSFSIDLAGLTGLGAILGADADAEVTVDFWAEGDGDSFELIDSQTVTVDENDIVQLAASDAFDAVSFRAADDEHALLRIESLEVGTFYAPLDASPATDDPLSA